jgi:hypothetical protein
MQSRPRHRPRPAPRSSGAQRPRLPFCRRKKFGPIIGSTYLLRQRRQLHPRHWPRLAPGSSRAQRPRLPFCQRKKFGPTIGSTYLLRRRRQSHPRHPPRLASRSSRAQTPRLPFCRRKKFRVNGRRVKSSSAAFSRPSNGVSSEPRVLAAIFRALLPRQRKQPHPCHWCRLGPR